MPSLNGLGVYLTNCRPMRTRSRKTALVLINGEKRYAHHYLFTFKVEVLDRSVFGLVLSTFDQSQGGRKKLKGRREPWCMNDDSGGLIFKHHRP